MQHAKVFINIMCHIITRIFTHLSDVRATVTGGWGGNTIVPVPVPNPGADLRVAGWQAPVPCAPPVPRPPPGHPIAAAFVASFISHSAAVIPKTARGVTGRCECARARDRRALSAARRR